jgi:hypothetical protein
VTAIGVHLPLSRRWTTGSNWDFPAGDDDESLITKSLEAPATQIRFLQALVAKT